MTRLFALLAILLLPVAAAAQPHSLALGNYHACVATGGRAVCWGANHVAQIGDGSLRNAYAPIAVAHPTDVVAVAAGVGHTCALTIRGEVWCWGANYARQAGDAADDLVMEPRRVALPSPARRVFAGAERSCALLDDGAYCWGSRAPQPVNDRPASAIPMRIPGAEGALDLQLGFSRSCVLRRDRTVHCWEGTFWDTAATTPVPPRAIPTPPGVVQIAVLRGSVLARLRDGSIRILVDDDHRTPSRPAVRDAVALAGEEASWCVARRATVECGRFDGSVTSQPIAGALDIDLRGDGGCVLRTGNQVTCWGSNDYGQLARRGPGDAPGPVDVPVLRAAAPRASGGVRQGITRSGPPPVTPTRMCGPAAPTPPRAGSGRPDGVPPSLCGNGRRDTVAGPTICAPCAYGAEHCPCSPTSETETCDGRDLGGQTCTSLGFAGGTLRCRDCTLDTSGCDSCARSPEVECRTHVVPAVSPSSLALAVAATGDRAAVSWRERPTTGAAAACDGRALVIGPSLQPLGAVQSFSAAAGDLSGGPIAALVSPGGRAFWSLQVESVDADLAGFGGTWLWALRQDAVPLGTQSAVRVLAGRRGHLPLDGGIQTTTAGGDLWIVTRDGRVARLAPDGTVRARHRFVTRAVIGFAHTRPLRVEIGEGGRIGVTPLGPDLESFGATTWLNAAADGRVLDADGEWAIASTNANGRRELVAISLVGPRLIPVTAEPGLGEARVASAGATAIVTWSSDRGISIARVGTPPGGASRPAPARPRRRR